MLFSEHIEGWNSWGRVFQSAEAFEPILRAICMQEGLGWATIETCPPGTNAVFKVGCRVLKIYAPIESGMNTFSDYQAELFGLNWARKLEIPAPGLVCSGYFDDRYRFYYLGMDYVPGVPFGEVRDSLNEVEKERVGRQVREMTTILNTPAGPFNQVDWLENAISSPRWTGFSKRLTEERRHFLGQLTGSSPVYVHGDITAENLLYQDGALCLIDFADGCLAPADYELGPVLTDLFRFDSACLRGYCGEVSPSVLADRLLTGLLIHSFGGAILKALFGELPDVESLWELKQLLIEKING